MIKELRLDQYQEFADFLRRISPEQIEIVEGDYFKHGVKRYFAFSDQYGKTIGCIAYCIQLIGQDQKAEIIQYKTKKLTEAKIIAFAVEPGERSKGIGKLLQKHVIEDARSNKCYQLTSYSTFDKVPNYAVKLSLGFCIIPEIQPNGIAGSYFVMKL